MILGIIAFVLFFSFGCNTVKRDTRSAYKIHYRNPKVLQRYCSDTYPPTDSVSIQKEYIQGEEHIDTLLAQDTLVFNDTVFIMRTVTKTVTATDTLRDTKYVVQVNKAGIALRDDQIVELTKSNTELTQSNNNKKRTIWILGGLIGLIVIIKLVRMYLKGKAKFVGL